jgi:hypothetical protein
MAEVFLLFPVNFRYTNVGFKESVSVESNLN